MIVALYWVFDNILHYLSYTLFVILWSQVITQLGVDQIQTDDALIPEHLLF